MYNYHDNEPEQNYWISYTDLVTGFMIIFIIIALVLFNRPEPTPQKPTPIPPPTTDTFKVVTVLGKYEELSQVFEEKLSDYEEIFVADSATIRFSAVDKELLFVKSDYYPTDYFKKLLDKFLPIYFGEIKKIYKSYSDSINIKELRIEGHTDSSGDYLTNLRYSSGRSQKVQNFILRNDYFKDLDGDLKDFIMRKSVAVGYSESRLLDENGEFVSVSGLEEDESKSRRVEFRILLEKKAPQHEN